MTAAPTALELLQGVDLTAGSHTASRRAHEILCKLDSDQQPHWLQAVDLLNSLTDIVEALFLLSAMRSACLIITRQLHDELRAAADAQDQDQERRTPVFPDPGENDDFLFVQLRGTTLQWARLALDHAHEVWPDPQQRVDYFAGMAQVAYNAGDDIPVTGPASGSAPSSR